MPEPTEYKYTSKTDVILRNLVRLQASELLNEYIPDSADSFRHYFPSWRPGLSLEETSKESSCLIFSLCDYLYNHLQHSSTLDILSPELLAGLPMLSKRQNDDRMLLGENMKLYDYWRADDVLEDDRDGVIDQGLIGNHRRWNETIRLAVQAARSNFPVLITGETGVGKELIASLIHNNSRFSEREIVTINCAALPEDLVISELFGYTDGAFTGAKRSGKTGWFEKATGTTLVLDEISELSQHAQTTLLRALQSGELQKVGGEVIHVDFRLISISNRSLYPEIDAGRFRQDLFYRIEVIPIEVPPLRERKADIRLLAEHFLRKFHRTNPNLSAQCISESALEKLNDYHWPGNVRELENVVARALVLCDKQTIQPHHLVFNSSRIQAAPTVDLNLVSRLEEINDSVISRLDKVSLACLLQDATNGLSSGDYARHFNCSDSTARRHLEILRSKRILTREGEKRGSKYTLIREGVLREKAG